MRAILEQLQEEISCPTKIVEQEIDKQSGPWKRWTLFLVRDKYARPILAVVEPPGCWPVTVDYYHLNPAQSTGYRYEWGIDPNDGAAHRRNKPTIDNDKELLKLCRCLLQQEEARRTVARMQG